MNYHESIKKLKNGMQNVKDLQTLLGYGPTYVANTYEGGKLDKRLRGNHMVIIGSLTGLRLYFNHSGSMPEQKGDGVEYMLQKVSPLSLLSSESIQSYMTTFLKVLGTQIKNKV